MLLTSESLASTGSSSAIVDFIGWREPTLTCPQKLKTLLATVSWKPLTNESVMIITATLITVAVTESRMINRENDFCWLNAMRRAIKDEIFTNKSLNQTLLLKLSSVNKIDVEVKRKGNFLNLLAFDLWRLTIKNNSSLLNTLFLN